jgi:hypothetical protein
VWLGNLNAARIAPIWSGRVTILLHPFSDKKSTNNEDMPLIIDYLLTFFESEVLVQSGMVRGKTL